MGSSFTGDPEGCVLEGSGDEASLSMGAVRGTWRGGSFATDPEGYKRKALGTGISLYGAQFGNLEWAHLPGFLRHG